MRITGVPDKAVALRPTRFADLDLTGKRLVVVGGTNGLGRAIASLALQRGAEVEVAGRTLRDGPHERLRFTPVDLSSLRAATDVGRRLHVEPVDVVLFTNGIFAARGREETAEGVERDMAVSYLSRMAMLRGLAPRLGTERSDGAAPPRVFIMAAPGTGALGNPADLNADAGRYRAMTAHMNTVAANEALVITGQDRLPGPAYFGLNPGVVRTGIRSNYLGDGSALHRFTEAMVAAVSPAPETYAARMVPLLFNPDLTGRTGLMFSSKGVPILPSKGMDQARANRFFDASETLLHQALA